MIKKDLKICVYVGVNSLKLRNLMAEHLEGMGIDGETFRLPDRTTANLTIDCDGPDSWIASALPYKDGYKEITVAEFFNLTESDLKEPERFTVDMKYKAGKGHICGSYTQDQIDRVLAILNEGES